MGSGRGKLLREADKIDISGEEGPLQKWCVLMRTNRVRLI